jgi:hypothetical protein
VTDLIDQIEEVRVAFGDPIQAPAQRDREMQAEEEQEEIDLATAEEVDLGITPFAEAWESLINAGPFVALQAYMPQAIQLRSTGVAICGRNVDRNDEHPRGSDNVEQTDWSTGKHPAKLAGSDHSRSELPTLENSVDARRSSNIDIQGGALPIASEVAREPTDGREHHDRNGLPPCVAVVVGGGSPGSNVARVSPQNCPAHRTSPGVIVEAGTREEEAAADEERKAAFLEAIRALLRTVLRQNVINADESAFLLHVAGRTGGPGDGRRESRSPILETRS